MEYIVHYDIAALVMLVILTLVYGLYRKFPSRQTRMYRNLLIVTEVSTALDIATCIGYKYTAEIPLALSYLLNMAFLVAFNAVPLLYNLFLLEMVYPKRLGWRKWLIASPYLVDVIMIITTPLHHQIFYFDEQGAYCHGKGFYALYILSLAYLFLGLFQTVSNVRKMTGIQRLATIFYTVSNILVEGLQLIFPEYLILEFAVAIALFLIYLTLQNPLEYCDARSGILNREAFMKVVEEEVQTVHRFTAIGIELEGTQIVRERMGTETERRIVQELCTFLIKLVGQNRVFKIEGTQVAVLTDNRKAVEKSVIEWVKTPYAVKDLKVNLWVNMLCVEYPDDIDQATDFLRLMDFCAKNKRRVKENTVFYGNGEIINRMYRELRLEKVLERAIEEESFEVYYQPIFDWRANAFTGVEALARLYDEEMGFISPDEFITLAEKTGQVIKIGEIIFRKVCEMVRTNHPEQYGVERIHVNLSVLQCLQENLAKHFLQTLDEYGIAHEMIGFEITETTTADMSESIRRNLEVFWAAGIRLAMDDYGTGYTNMVNMVNYRYNTVKIDKSLLWTAGEEKAAALLLKHSIEMFRLLGMKVVVEGVENREHVEILQEYGADLFQGYYYAKPMPEDAYIEFMQGEQ